MTAGSGDPSACPPPPQRLIPPNARKEGKCVSRKQGAKNE